MYNTVPHIFDFYNFRRVHEEKVSYTCKSVREIVLFYIRFLSIFLVINYLFYIWSF